MNAVGIDISKGKSMVAIMRPFGEVVASPFEVMHTDSELRQLANRLKSLNGETKVIMECTGNYFYPVAYALHEAELFVSAVHAEGKHYYSYMTAGCAKLLRIYYARVSEYLRTLETDD